MSMVKVEPTLGYNDVVRSGQIFFTKRGNKITAKATVLDLRMVLIEYNPVEAGFASAVVTNYRGINQNTVRGLRDTICRATSQTEAGLSILISNAPNEQDVLRLRDSNVTLEAKVEKLTKALAATVNQIAPGKLMLSVGPHVMASYKESFSVGDSFVLICGITVVGFVNVSSKKSVVIYDDAGRYIKTYPANVVNGLISVGDIRGVLKEAGMDGYLHLRQDVYAAAYRENAIALMNGTTVPHNQLAQHAATETAPAVTQQQGGKFILWAPDSSIPPRVIMEGRNMANSIAEQMNARHGKDFYVCQLVRKVETITKVVKTFEKKVTDL